MSNSIRVWPLDQNQIILDLDGDVNAILLGDETPETPDGWEPNSGSTSAGGSDVKTATATINTKKLTGSS